MTEFALDGHGESLKGWYHVGLCVVATGAAAYNLWACCLRPRKRVAIGAVGYTALAAVEALVATQHFAAHRHGYAE